MTEKDYRPIEPAQLAKGDGPVLKSTAFQDIYFSDLGGYAETRHVFLNGNDLPKRFSELDNTHFCIGELGFGTGLNIIALMKLWDETAPPGNHLQIWSVEGYPLSTEDFSDSADQISKNWPDLKPYADRLKTLYPPLTRNVHYLHLSDTVSLTLVFDDVDEALRQATGPIDAWFLDGFSPSLNPDMWDKQILNTVGKISSNDSTFATFTVARIVRDGLEKAGFELAKKPGFGRKRDMLTGRLPRTTTPLKKPMSQKDILIKGGGIAGASLAWHLAKAGLTPLIHDPDGLAAEASGNPAGLIMPRLDLDTTPAARFYRAAYLYTLHILDEIKAVDNNIFLQCGVLQLSVDEKSSDRARKLIESKIMPESHAALVTTETAHQLAKIDLKIDASLHHLWFPQAGMIDPVRYTKFLGADHTSTDALPPPYLTIHANSLQATDLIKPANSLYPNLGQIDYFPAASSPACAITLGAYIGPAPSGGVIIGATYDREAPARLRPKPAKEQSQRNKDQLVTFIPSLENYNLDDSQARAAFRCVTPDKHPVADQLGDNGFILSGLGSRGLVTAPLLAAMITSKVTGTVSPTGLDVEHLMRAERFAERAQKRA